ncbi:hypothetical protein S40285_08116 [Stachybotrys chlorohalonatus IBT 40285]|uniref:Nudix hydrolase domain-containing protein n=1 Tax=Stachybotrys chlorohalonatus (strain IBT 40285) TaxID=1283841 RepID=A0A084R0J5_STAC4|nr:hypothetical protein S40285_08116 [Stachybotrys chlorohalonata IBT 40285]
MASQSADGPPPRVGIGAIVSRPDGKVVVGKRLSPPGAGSLQMPGGHLEYGEDILNCAEREVLEETGLRVRGVKIVTVTNSVFEPEHLHYVTVITYCEVLEPDAEPRSLEPDKCESWTWMSWDELRALKGDSAPGEVLFHPVHKVLDQPLDLESLRPSV